MAGKFSINNMDKVIELVGTEPRTFEGKFLNGAAEYIDDYTFEMRLPTMTDISEIVNNVVSDCFPIMDRDENGLGGVETYAPEFKSFLTKYYIIVTLTNISLPKDFEKTCGIVEFVFNNSNIDTAVGNYYGVIESAIDKRIEHKLNLMAVCREELIDSLVQQVAQLTSDVEELGGYVAEFADKLDKSFGGESVDSALAKLDEISKRSEIKVNAKD